MNHPLRQLLQLISQLWRRLFSLVRRGRYEREMEEEMRFHTSFVGPRFRSESERGVFLVLVRSLRPQRRYPLSSKRASSLTSYQTWMRRALLPLISTPLHRPDGSNRPSPQPHS